MMMFQTLLAQADLDLVPSQAGNINNLTIPGIVNWAVTFILVVAGIIFLFMLIWGGIRWILSGGDKAQTEAARNTITSALIGLVVVFSAWAIANLLNTIFGVNILDFDIPSVVGGS